VCDGNPAAVEGWNVTEPEKKRVFPYMSANTWGDLRRKLRSSIPKAIDKDYLQSILSISEKAAANLLPQLRNVGLVTQDGAPTELVHDFRDDEHYPEFCQKVIATIYPDSLTDAFPDPEGDFDGVVRWFMRNSGAGEATAKFQARFFTMLQKSEPPEPAEKPKRSASKQATPKAASPTKPNQTTNGGGDTTAAIAPDRAATAEERSTTRAPKGGPSLHIDVQIHIDAAASLEQIDAVFSSMAKHLYE
jgi:hypothetical protein